jgi:hypothetical protein
MGTQKQDLASKKTTDLLRKLETERLTGKEIRAIKAELAKRVI